MMADAELQAVGNRAFWEDGARILSPRSFSIRLSVHLCCAACLGVFVLWGIMAEPPVRGFFCGDTSIRYPLKPETVPAGLATALLIGLPVIIFVLVELLQAFVVDLSGLELVQLQCCSLPKMLLDMYTICGGFAFGLLVNFGLADVAKICVGRLRPHFISVCEPDWSSLSCSDATGDLFVEKYECNGQDKSAIREARLSFFSAHSSNAMCAMMYTAIYLQCRLTKPGAGPGSAVFRLGIRSNKSAEWLWDAATALRPFVQAALLLLAVFIAISRVMDFFHHPGDVIAGLSVGTAVGIYSAVYVSRLPQLGQQ